MSLRWRAGVTVALVAAVVAWGPSRVAAHCDTLDGPVVTDARQALAQGQVTPVLKWVRTEDEAAVRTAFEDAVALKPLGDRARAVGERQFFETLVRLHRAGEGAPYTGLAAGPAEPAARLADQALADGKPDAAIQALSDEIAAGLRHRYAEVRERQAHAQDSVAAGRAYVASYVAWVHYVEGLHQAATGPVEAHAHAEH